MMVIRSSPEREWEAIEASLFFNFDYKKYPEIESLVSVEKPPTGESTIVCDGSVYTMELLIVDSTFSDVFNFNFIVGNGKSLLSDPDAIILTEQMAQRIFGNLDPIGKEVKITAEIEKIYTIKGIAETPPSNSSITFDVIVPSHSARFSSTGADFIMTKRNFNKEAFIKKITNLGRQHPQFNESTMSIIPLDDIYFNKAYTENARNVFTRSGDKHNLFVLYVILMLILLITVLNY